MCDLKQCSCGWTASKPNVSVERGELTNYIMGYRIICIGCTKNTGYLDSLEIATKLWNIMVENSPKRNQKEVLALCIENK